MIDEVTILDKTFLVYITADQIESRVNDIADKLNKSHNGKIPLFLAVLNGSFIFAADLLKKISIECEVSFIKLASYFGTSSTGEITTMIGLSESLKGKDIIIVEDIIDTGRTMKYLLEILHDHNPASITTVMLLFKKDALIENIIPDLVGFEVPDKFLVGYGLDYNGIGRNMENIYVLKEG
jgi:hypoxanthine phosphoribosyltransferase